MFSAPRIRTFLLDHPKTSLTVCFAQWKLFLLGIAFFSPGSGYDTSTRLLHGNRTPTEDDPLGSWRHVSLLEKLVRWDAIYFTKVAQRGYQWEQEWAFGWGFTNLIGSVSSGQSSDKVHSIDLTLSVPFLQKEISSAYREAFAGVFVAHASHLLSVLMLHKLTSAIFTEKPAEWLSKFAFITASLHVVSPAGLFLSAPYAESTFSFLTFLGLYLYVKAHIGGLSNSLNPREILLVLSAGVTLGTATTFRGNGLLSGLVLVYDAIKYAESILRLHNIKTNCGKLLVVCFSGSVMALIAFLPQYLAYSEYCNRSAAEEVARPWCSRWMPSIYGWVQEHYW